MKKVILTFAVAALLSSCNKNNNTAPSNSNNNNNINTVPTGTVYCWYQVFNGMNTFYTCTSNQSEYNQISTYCAANQMNMVVSQKNSCTECQ